MQASRDDSTRVESTRDGTNSSRGPITITFPRLVSLTIKPARASARARVESGPGPAHVPSFPCQAARRREFDAAVAASGSAERERVSWLGSPDRVR